MPKPVTINIPQALREPCPKADLASPETIGELGALVIHLEADLAVCDQRRAGLISLIDAHAETVRPKGWVDRLLGR